METDCLTAVAPGTEAPDRERSERRYHLGTTKEAPLASAAGAERNFSGGNTPDQSSQPSQRSRDNLADMIDSSEEPPDPEADELAAAVNAVEQAIGEGVENPGVFMSPQFLESFTLIRERDPEEWLRLRVRIKKEKPSGVLLGDIDKATKPQSDSENDGTVADDLVDLVRELGHLFHAPDGAAFVTVADGAVEKTFKLDTKAFDDWLSYAFFSKTEEEFGKGCAASDTAIRTAKTALNGIAKHRGEEMPVYLRCAPWQNGYVIDLGADDWRVIEVLPTGWPYLTSRQ
ncbi:MAG: hypothetical protein H6R26_836 [Proteobacteria bacterium]|nr:hypothetical protein [Pseudomonadota bacterium]